MQSEPKYVPFYATAEQRDEFVGLDAEIVLRLDQIGAVACHTHILQRDGHPALVRLGQKVVSAPFRDEPRDGLTVLFMYRPLLLRHFDEELFVEPLGKFEQHVFLETPDED